MLLARSVERVARARPAGESMKRNCQGGSSGSGSQRRPTDLRCAASRGGYIAFEMVRQAPDRIERLALLDTSALSDTPEQTERRLKLIAMAQTGEYKSVRDTLWPLFVHPARHDNVALKRAVFIMMDDTGPETFIRQQKAIMSRLDSRSSL